MGAVLPEPITRNRPNDDRIPSCCIAMLGLPAFRHPCFFHQTYHPFTHRRVPHVPRPPVRHVGHHLPLRRVLGGGHFASPTSARIAFASFRSVRAPEMSP